MKGLLKSAIVILLVVTSVLAVRAEGGERPVRPVTSAWTLGFGTSHLTDSYLSPLHYDGTASSITYERFQAMRFDPDRWVMGLTFKGVYASAKNPARNATMRDVDIVGSWRMMRRFDVPSVAGLTLMVGGSATADGGALLLARNGNNPVSAKAAMTLDIAGMAVWNTHIGRLPVTLRWSPTLPVVGVFFSPDYGELYYEIYLGNSGNLSHFAWFGNRFALTSLLTADLRFGGTSLRVGYDFGFMNSKVNNIVSRSVIHMFSLGIATEWLSLNPRKPLSPAARIVSAYY